MAIHGGDTYDIRLGGIGRTWGGGGGGRNDVPSDPATSWLLSFSVTQSRGLRHCARSKLRSAPRFE